MTYDASPFWFFFAQVSKDAAERLQHAEEHEAIIARFARENQVVRAALIDMAHASARPVKTGAWDSVTGESDLAKAARGSLGVTP